MNAAIFLRDITTPGKLSPVEDFQFDIEKDGLETVKNRLKLLQKGYYPLAERMRIGALKENNSLVPGKKIKALYADSGMDFSYIAFLGMKLKNPIS